MRDWSTSVKRLEVLEQLAGGVAVRAAGAPDAERAAGLVVVPGHDPAAADGAEGEPGGEDAVVLAAPPLGLMKATCAGRRSRAGSVGPVLVVGQLGRSHPRRDEAAAPAAHRAAPAPGRRRRRLLLRARRSRKSVALMNRAVPPRSPDRPPGPGRRAVAGAAPALATGGLRATGRRGPAAGQRRRAGAGGGGRRPALGRAGPRAARSGVPRRGSGSLAHGCGVLRAARCGRGVGVELLRRAAPVPTAGPPRVLRAGSARSPAAVVMGPHVRAVTRAGSAEVAAAPTSMARWKVGKAKCIVAQPRHGHLGVDRGGQQADHLAAVRRHRGRADQDPAVGVGHHLDHPARLVDPAAARRRDVGVPGQHGDPLPRGPAPR